MLHVHVFSNTPTLQTCCMINSLGVVFYKPLILATHYHIFYFICFKFTGCLIFIPYLLKLVFIEYGFIINRVFLVGKL